MPKRPTWVALLLCVALIFLARHFDKRPFYDREMKILQAETLNDDGRFDEAAALATTLIEDHPEWQSPYLVRSIAYRQKGDFARAASDLDHITSQQGQVPPELYYERAMLAQARGDLDRADVDLDQAIKAKPDMASASYQRALLRKRRGDLHGAIDDLDRALKDIRPASWLVERAKLNMFNLDHPAEAANDFAEAARQAINYRDSRLALNPPRTDGQPTAELMETGKPFYPEGYFMLLWAHYARFHAGQNDLTEMQGLLKDVAQPLMRRLLAENPTKSLAEAQAQAFEPWPGPIYRMFLRQISPRDILAKAENAPAPVRAAWQCQAHFYIAVFDRQINRDIEVEQELKLAQAQCLPDSMETAFIMLERQNQKP